MTALAPAAAPGAPVPRVRRRRAVARARLACWALAAPWLAAAQTALPPAESDERSGGLPRWEVGLVAGAGRLPDYPGADRSRLRGLVLPVLLYRGPVWRVDGDGLRSRLLAQPDWTLDLSASGAFRSRDNPAREGMPPLDWLVGLGPQLVWHGWRDAPGRPTLHLKARALLSTDGRDWHGRGHVLEPEVRWRWTAPLPGGPGRFSLGVQPTWASEGLQRYFYDVAPAQATAQRPAWNARAGYFGTELKLTLGRQESPVLSWFVTARALSLHGAANEGSPLLRERLNWSLGVGLVWTPWRSAETVASSR